MTKNLLSSDLLILGGTGFVGQSLLNYLEKTGSNQPQTGEIYVLARNKQVSSSFSVSPLLGDLTRVGLTLPEVDVIIHAATPASASLNITNPAEMYSLNLLAMKNLLDLVKTWRTTPRIIFTSSGAVYGQMPSSLMTFSESSELQNSSSLQSSAYADGKRGAEAMLREATDSGICTGIIARLFAFSGEHLPRDRHFAIGNFVESAITMKKIIVRSDGLSIRSYLDERDMAHWLLSIAQKGTSSQIYHIGSERAISIRELAYLVAERCELMTGVKIPVEILGHSSPLDGVSRYVPSTVQTREKLGLSETISLESSIDSMLLATISQYS